VCAIYPVIDFFRTSVSVLALVVRCAGGSSAARPPSLFRDVERHWQVLILDIAETASRTLPANTRANRSFRDCPHPRGGYELGRSPSDTVRSIKDQCIRYHPALWHYSYIVDANTLGSYDV
jgi:hypothetical protein